MAQRQFDDFLDELSSRVRIEDVVGEYVQLNRKGGRYWGLCPFHSEKSPSFNVDPDKRMYYCFGCHKGGNVYNFVCEMEHVEFMDAVRLLAERAHMDLPDRQPNERRAAERELRDSIYEANKLAARDFFDRIWTEEGAKAREYLFKRGLTDSDIRKFGLGASPAGWDDTFRALTTRGVERETLIAAGLVRVKDDRVYDMFRSRVMFPIINAQSKVIGFGGRALEDDRGPKYLNTQETPVFNKRRNLYCMNFVKRERGLSRIILVEGYMDAVALRKSGIEGVVATLGTALTTEQAGLIKGWASEIWVSYDSDSAGQQAILRALDVFDSIGARARVLTYQGAKDPDEFVKANGPEAFNALKPMDSFEFRLLRAMDDLDMTSQEGRTKYAIQAAAILKKCANPVELENYVAIVVGRTGFEKDIIYKQIGVTPEAAPKREQRAPRFRQDSSPEYLKAERALLGLAASGYLPESFAEETDFSDPALSRAYGLLRTGKKPADIIDEFEADERGRVIDAMQFIAPPGSADLARKMAADSLSVIRRHRIQLEMAEVAQKMATETDEIERAGLIQKYAALEKLKDRI